MPFYIIAPGFFFLTMNVAGMNILVLIFWNTFSGVYILHFQCKRIWILVRAFDPHPFFAPEMLRARRFPVVVRLGFGWSRGPSLGQVIRVVTGICSCHQSAAIQTAHQRSLPCPDHCLGPKIRFLTLPRT